jgi:hypothetical protein
MIAFRHGRFVVALVVGPRRPAGKERGSITHVNHHVNHQNTKVAILATQITKVARMLLEYLSLSHEYFGPCT